MGTNQEQNQQHKESQDPASVQDILDGIVDIPSFFYSLFKDDKQNESEKNTAATSADEVNSTEQSVPTPPEELPADIADSATESTSMLADAGESVADILTGIFD